MDSNNWRAAQGQVPIQGQVIGGDAVAAGGGMEGPDWRTQLRPDSRQRIVNKILETLKGHLPFSGQEGLQELKKIAVRFEEKIYTAATSQSDYLRKISLKMLSMETKSQNPKSPQDPGSQSMQPQMQNQVQQLPVPMVSNQSQIRQHILSQNIQNNIPPTGVPNSAGLTSALQNSVGGMSQGTIPNNPVQNPSMQNMSNVAANVVGNSMGQGAQTNLSGFQQQQMVGIQHGNSSLQNSQQPVHMLQQSKVAVQQQLQQNMMRNQTQSSQLMQQQLMSQIQSHPGQLQQQMGLQQQGNTLSGDMQQRIQTSGPMLQQQPAIDQKQLMQSQRVADVPMNQIHE